MANKKSTIFTGMRLEKELVNKIELIAKDNGIDKTSVIKQAIQLYLDDFDQDIEDQLIKDYINLRIDEKELLKELEWKEIPKDLQEARKEVLNRIKQEARGK